MFYSPANEWIDAVKDFVRFSIGDSASSGRSKFFLIDMMGVVGWMGVFSDFYNVLLRENCSISFYSSQIKYGRNLIDCLYLQSYWRSW